MAPKFLDQKYFRNKILSTQYILFQKNFGNKIFPNQYFWDQNLLRPKISGSENCQHKDFGPISFRPWFFGTYNIFIKAQIKKIQADHLRT